jgi:hypothetical protein
MQIIDLSCQGNLFQKKPMDTLIFNNEITKLNVENLPQNGGIFYFQNFS